MFRRFLAWLFGPPPPCPRCRGFGLLTTSGQPIPLDRTVVGVPCPACDPDARPAPRRDDTPMPREVVVAVDGRCPACGIMVPAWLRHECPGGPRVGPLEDDGDAD